MLVLANCQRARSMFTVGRSLRGRRAPARRVAGGEVSAGWSVMRRPTTARRSGGRRRGARHACPARPLGHRRARRSRRPLQAASRWVMSSAARPSVEGEQVRRQRVGGAPAPGVLRARRARGSGSRPAARGRQPRAGVAHPTARSPSADRGGQPVGQARRARAQPDAGQHGDELLVVGGAAADAQVLRQCGVEDVGMLLDEADDVPDVVGGKTLEGHAVESDLAGVGREEAHEHVGEGRFAGAARSDERDAAPGPQFEIDAAQRGAPGARIRGPDVVQRERVRPVAERDRVARVADHRRRVHGGEDPARGHAGRAAAPGSRPGAVRRARRRRVGRAPEPPAAHRSASRGGWR